MIQPIPATKAKSIVELYGGSVEDFERVMKLEFVMYPEIAREFGKDRS